jgi:hypothetical protein
VIDNTAAAAVGVGTVSRDDVDDEHDVHDVAPEPEHTQSPLFLSVSNTLL